MSFANFSSNVSQTLSALLHRGFTDRNSSFPSPPTLWLYTGNPSFISQWPTTLLLFPSHFIDVLEKDWVCLCYRKDCTNSEFYNINSLCFLFYFLTTPSFLHSGSWVVLYLSFPGKEVVGKGNKEGLPTISFWKLQHYTQMKPSDIH
jgi:hypothetical protein